MATKTAKTETAPVKKTRKARTPRDPVIVMQGYLSRKVEEFGGGSNGDFDRTTAQEKLALVFGGLDAITLKLFLDSAKSSMSAVAAARKAQIAEEASQLGFDLVPRD